jgi:hypothetical protein
MATVEITVRLGRIDREVRIEVSESNSFVTTFDEMVTLLQKAYGKARQSTEGYFNA